jgi:hypothetical protein
VVHLSCALWQCRTLSASGAELAADPLHCQGFDVLKAELPVEPERVDAIRCSKYDTNGLPSGPDPDGPRDPRRQQTIDASGTAKWNQELRVRLAGCLRARHMLACSSGEKAIRKMHAIKSLPTPGYDPEKVDPQEGDQEAHADEDLANLARYMDGRSLKDMPLSVIVALMPGTRLRIRRLDTHEWVIVHLEPGDVLVFCGDVCHNGLGYASENVRVHAYVYPSDYKPRASSINTCHA